MSDGDTESSIGKRRHQAPRIAAVLGACALVLAACSSSHAPLSSGTTPKSHQKPIKGGVASYALPIGEDFSWMLPLENQANYEDYDSNVEGGMWRPLYFAGGAGTTGVNPQLSIANPPVYSNNNKTVTITLKHDYTWSDGTPVTSTDVRFFFALEAAAAKAGKYGPYVPGEMPDDISSVSYQGPYKFTMSLKQSYNPQWFTGNQLTWIYPLPAQTWDKTCATCTVNANAAATPKGALAVFNFLYQASSNLPSYSTNPLWKVVDGPWVLTSYDPTTFHSVFKANPKYTGRGKPHLSGYEIYAFSSDTAEVDAVRSGIVDFGFLPYTDLASASTYTNQGYTIKPWRYFYNEVAEFGYTNKTAGPLVKQLYVRQALQHLVNEPLYLSAALKGYGLQDYGSAPDYPNSPFVSPALKKDPYPYSISAAKKLLAAHGWTKSSNGTDSCSRPGTAANECGAGIAKGTPLSLSFMYSTGTQSYLSQVEAFQTAARQAGVTINLNGQSENTMYSIAGVCPPGPCNWGLAGYAGFMWDFGQYELLPVGGNQFGKGNYWAGGYNSPEAQRLINYAHTHAGLKPIYAVENYLSKNVASLWWPLADYEIVLAKNTLQGWYPLNPYANFRPSTWYFVK
ncbi:MAG: ABC transporter substrate-binding protein [Acidimicrobiales bacterium]